MALKTLKGQEWFSMYAWFEYPFMNGAQEEAQVKENNQNSVNGGASTLKKSNLRPKSGGKNGKSVKFGEGQQEEVAQDNLQEEIKGEPEEIEP